MVCKKCNTANADNTMFCTNCGAMLDNSASDSSYGSYNSFENRVPAVMPAGGMAVASLVLGIVSILTGFTLLGIIGLILGYVAGAKGNTSGVKTAGIVLGWISVVLAIIAIIAAIVCFLIFGAAILAPIIVMLEKVGMSTSSMMYY